MGSRLALFLLLTMLCAVWPAFAPGFDCVISFFFPTANGGQTSQTSARLSELDLVALHLHITREGLFNNLIVSDRRRAAADGLTQLHHYHYFGHCQSRETLWA